MIEGRVLPNRSLKRAAARNAGPQDFIEMAYAIPAARNSQCNDGSAETVDTTSANQPSYILPHLSARSLRTTQKALNTFRMLIGRI